LGLVRARGALTTPPRQFQTRQRVLEILVLEFEITWSGKSESVRLEDGEHAVGRARDNEVRVAEVRVSKRHARLRVECDRLWVRDLDSTNGTWVDGQKVGQDEVEVPPDAEVSFAGAALRRASTGRPAMTSFLTHTQLSTVARHSLADGYSPGARDRIVGFSSELFELIASGDDSEDIEAAACRFVAQCVAADRVALLKDHGEASTIEISAHWKKGPRDDTAPFHLSSTIVEQVVRRRESVLVANPLEDSKYTGSESIMSLNLRSAMAAPLFDNERVRGILYVDTADPTVRYTSDDLQVLTATANGVAVKLRSIGLESEIKTAARIQQAMLPETLDPPPMFELEAHQVMCRDVGGDLYHCLRRPNGKTLIALGDVSGKGTPAALAMSAAMVLIGTLADIGGDIVETAKQLHFQLFRSLAVEHYLTLFIGELDPESGLLHYVNAGHEPPLLVRANGKMEQLAPTGLPIAMVEENVLEGGETRIEPGDLLCVFSDGIPEATTDGQRFLGSDVVKDIVCSQPGESLSGIRDRIVAAVQEFLAGAPVSDDVTLMLLRRKQG